MVNGPDNSTESVQGLVLEALPSANFRVKLDGDKEIVAYLSGKMRLHRIRVLVGDKVTLALDQYRKRGRITKRL
ncbi:MAG: translation initiation factor IF-1 [Parcubacteria group bacterium RIFCSPHIGHO2_01_FULL_45_26]|nr:MAG: translation initiation factor IF-1 [Parcubacteria group bacterium RIFCSPHIGHO2_01_FULL_45_26]